MTKWLRGLDYGSWIGLAMFLAAAALFYFIIEVRWIGWVFFVSGVLAAVAIALDL